MRLQQATIAQPVCSGDAGSTRGSERADVGDAAGTQREQAIAAAIGQGRGFNDAGIAEPARQGEVQTARGLQRAGIVQARCIDVQVAPGASAEQRAAGTIDDSARGLQRQAAAGLNQASIVQFGAVEGNGVGQQPAACPIVQRHWPAGSADDERPARLQQAAVGHRQHGGGSGGVDIHLA